MLVGGGTSWEDELGNKSNVRPSGTPMLRLASEVEISPTFLNPRSRVGAVDNHNPFERRLGGVMPPEDGVEVGGVVATKWTSSGAPTLVEQRVQTGGDGLVLGLSVTSSPGRMMTLDDRVPVAKMGLARKPKPKVPESAGQGKLLGLPFRP